MTAKKTESPNFEKALERLEAIVGEMEAGSLELDKMMTRFEEGMGLVKFCTAKLNEVEKKIEILVKKSDRTVAEPFDQLQEDQMQKKKEALE